MSCTKITDRVRIVRQILLNQNSPDVIELRNLDWFIISMLLLYLWHYYIYGIRIGVAFHCLGNLYKPDGKALAD